MNDRRARAICTMGESYTEEWKAGTVEYPVTPADQRRETGPTP